MKSRVLALIISLSVISGCATDEVQTSPLSPLSQSVNSSANNKIVINSSMNEMQEIMLIDNALKSNYKLDGLLGIVESFADLKPKAQKYLIEKVVKENIFKEGERKLIVKELVKTEITQLLLIDFSLRSPFKMEALSGVALGFDKLSDRLKQFFIEKVTSDSTIKPAERQSLVAEISKTQATQLLLIGSSLNSPYRLDALLGLISSINNLDDRLKKFLIEKITNDSTIKPAERQKLISELAKNNITN